MTIDVIKGVGPSMIKKLNKLNINTIDDLILYYPFRYDVISRSDVTSLEDGDKIIIDGFVESNPSVFHFNRRMDKMTFRLNTGLNIFNVIIFNRSFLKPSLNLLTKIIVIGKYDRLHNTVVASDIRFGVIPATPVIEPVYHSINGLSSKQISSFIYKAFNYEYNLVNYIPDYLVRKYNLLDKNESVRIIHKPINLNELKKAQNTLKYEELFLFMLKMNCLKMSRNNKIGIKRYIDMNKVNEFINSLEFSLTSDQVKCVHDIYNDLTNERRMNRLVQGDVGSGKTIVSFISIYMNFLCGMQSALMAPTEILAVQHYNNMKNLFKNFNIKIELLTGKTKAKEKKEILSKLKSGDIDVIVGTHALISEGVIYNSLSLVITDEQHRFGVNQRGNLKNKGITPDILYMSATPIPRTYALTIYGDMDISSIHTMPSGRKDIITYLKKEEEISSVLSMISDELKKNHQVYVIAPLIEESDSSDLENIKELESKMNKAFGKFYKVGILHGKMSNLEKDDVMDKFKTNEINILVSTTVVEVGVDVKNATMIVIFDAYRFGLSQLHQLRGRVGRNELQSYCVLISSKETKRLEVLTKTNNGFEVSEEDFKIRGSGDLFGIRQSGDMCFSISNIKNDFNILVKAKEDSYEYLINKEYLKEKNKSVNDLLESSINLD